MGRRIASTERPASSARVFKTEFILDYLSQPALRTRIRRGLLKGEQLHALARCVHYGRLGRLDHSATSNAETGAASCLFRILAAIIYWQIREIDRVLSEAGSDADDLNFELLSHISPIGWDNVLLYGASTSSTAVSCEAKGLAYKFARFWALPWCRPEYAASVIQNAAGEEAMAPADAVECARRLRAVLNARFGPHRMLVEHPVKLVQDNGQVLHGWIDLLIETGAGWIVIDHKSSPRPRSEWTDEALEYSGQLTAYASALNGAGLECAKCWVHFPVSGGLVEVVLNREAK